MCQLPTGPITEERIREFYIKLSTAYRNMDYARFCEIMQIEEGDYAMKKWLHWQNMCYCVGNFDIETLTRIINYNITEVVE